MAATKSIELRTGIPGPRSQGILERKAQVVADPEQVALSPPELKRRLAQ